MQEKDITTPIIDKCKELAKHWRMEIYEGCWVHLEEWEEKIFLVTEVNGEDIEVSGFHWISTRGFFSGEDFPIPSISDCLEKLRELGWTNVDITLDQNLKGQTRCLLYIDKVDHRGFVTDNKNKRHKKGHLLTSFLFPYKISTSCLLLSSLDSSRT